MTAFIADYRNSAPNSDDRLCGVSFPQWLADDVRPAARPRNTASVRTGAGRSRTVHRTQERTGRRPVSNRPSNLSVGGRRPNTRGTARLGNSAGVRSNTADHRHSPVRGPIQGVRRTPGAFAAAVGLGLVFGAMMHFSGFGAPDVEPAPVAPTYVGAVESSVR